MIRGVIEAARLVWSRAGAGRATVEGLRRQIEALREQLSDREGDMRHEHLRADRAERALADLRVKYDALLDAHTEVCAEREGRDCEASDLRAEVERVREALEGIVDEAYRDGEGFYSVDPSLIDAAREALADAPVKHFDSSGDPCEDDCAREDGHPGRCRPASPARGTWASWGGGWDCRCTYETGVPVGHAPSVGECVVCDTLRPEPPADLAGLAAREGTR